eukprot:2639005-Amphidinium_carterae.1
MRAVSKFILFENSFIGPLPESGIRTMSAVTDFTIGTNGFEGSLPERGLAMHAFTGFHIYRN